MSDENKFLDELMERATGPRRIEVSCVFLKSVDVDAPPALLSILGVPQEDLAPAAACALKLLEEGKIESADWQDFKWKLLAFDVLQDIFDGAVFGGNVPDAMFRIWYFYYESRRLLVESVLCGLSGFYLGANSLNRPFMEFALLQNYFRRVVAEARSYEAFDRYLQSPVTPSRGTLISKAMPSDSFAKPIKARLQNDLSGLSASAAHAYHPIHSPRAIGADRHGHTLEGIFFWHQTRFVLQTVLWVYCANFPMLFVPVDVERKFGFNPPVGFFIDPVACSIFRKALGEEDFRLFEGYAKTRSEVTDLLSFYNSRRDLGEAEILGTWQASDGSVPETVADGRVQSLVKMRVLREGIACRPSADADVEPELVVAMRGLAGWRAYSRRAAPNS